MEQPITMDGLMLLGLQAVILALLIERATAQLKKISRATMQRPWPIVATVISALTVISFDVPVIAYITGSPASSKFGAFIGSALFALWIAGGAAVVVDTLKDAMRKREEIHQAKLP